MVAWIKNHVSCEHWGLSFDRIAAMLITQDTKKTGREAINVQFIPSTPNLMLELLSGCCCATTTTCFDSSNQASDDPKPNFSRNHLTLCAFRHTLAQVVLQMVQISIFQMVEQNGTVHV